MSGDVRSAAAFLARPLETPALLTGVSVVAFTLSVFCFVFWGYPLDGVNFNTLHFLSKEPFPDFWGLRIVDPQTNWVDLSFLYRNEGLMVAVLYIFYQMPVSLETKLVLVNMLNIAVQLLSAGLFAYVARKLVGSVRFFPYLFLFLLYPFAAANHYWAAGLSVNLAGTFFLGSLALFLNVDYAPGETIRNLVRWIVPSLLCLWCSIIMVEYAVFLSPLFVYLALYHINGRTAVLRFSRLLAPYSVIACLFLLTSILPVLLFTGHRLTMASYGARYSELAGQMHLPPGLVSLVSMTANGALVFASYLFANTLGVIVYPLVDVVRYAGSVTLLTWAGAVPIGLLGAWMAWRESASDQPKGTSVADAPDDRFLMVVGSLWAGLAYLPFLLSIGYPRNVGLTADRINIVGSMGVVFCLGTVWRLFQERLAHRFAFGPAAGIATSLLLAVVLLVNLAIQKAHYVEGEKKERALVGAVLDARERLLARGREPIFLLDRATKGSFPLAQLRLSLNESSWWGRFGKVAGFLFERHFVRTTISTSFHFNGIYFFWCCPASAPVTFNFYADWQGRPRPVVYKREEPFRVTEDAEKYTIGYANTEVWDDPLKPGEFRSYPKQAYELVVFEIGESTFRLGGAVAYSLKPYEEAGADGGASQRGA